MKTCPACSAENNADGKFCSACGGALVPGPEATVDHDPAKNASACPAISDRDSSAHGRFVGHGRKPLRALLTTGDGLVTARSPHMTLKQWHVHAIRLRD